MTRIHAKNRWRHIVIYLFLFLASPHCLSQLISNLSNELIAQGATGVASKGISSLQSNPSGSTSIKQITIAANYFMPYFTQELSNQNLSLVLPTKYGNVFSILDRFGYNLYNENRLTIGYAKSLSPAFNLCFQFNIQHNQIFETGSGQQIFSCLGIQFSPHNTVNIGFFAFNPEKANIKINTTKEAIPSYLNLGFRWQVQSNFSISSELNKTINYNTITKFGLEYKINRILTSRIGAYGKPMTYTLGIGVKMKSITIDTSMTNHQTLGISSGIGISYQFNSKQ